MEERYIGNCRVQEEIGKGGMAVVYRAQQESLGRPVAIKELKEEFFSDDVITARFKREAMSVASFQQENIVHVYDYVVDGDHRYIIMEYVEGTNLFDLLARVDRLPPDIAAIVALQLARALEYAHFRGVVHRDIKPSNVVISKMGEVKLMDFGIARAEALGDMTRPGVALGTPSYMSPEQIMGERVDWRSDLFSFGIVLYQMLTGRKPFRENDQRTVMQVILKDPYTPPRAIFPDIPRPLANVVERCLRKQPEHRYPSTEALRAALERYVARRVRINQCGRVVAFLHHRGLLSKSDALTVLTHEMLSQPSLERIDVAGPSTWRTRVAPIALAAAVGLGAMLVSAGVAEWWPSLTPQAATPLRTQGQLRINVWPWARVFVDGIYVDTTPFTRALPLAPGRHVIELRNEYYEDERREIEIQPDHTLTFNVEMGRRKGAPP